jgi:hypothetical protein
MVTGLSEPEARGTCTSMTKHKQACTPVRPDHSQVASR